MTRKRRRSLPISQKPPESKATKHFPGKLFRLVESCTLKSSRSSKNNQDKQDQILKWLPCPSEKHTSDNTFVISGNANNSNSNSNNDKKEGLLSLVFWDKDRFMDHHLVKTSFATQSTFRSFERQLNSWGFKRDCCLEEVLLARQDSRSNSKNKKQKSDYNIPIIITKESLRAFHHPCFQQGKPGLLEGVKRRPSGSGNKDIKETIAQAASESRQPATTKSTNHKEEYNYSPLTTRASPSDNLAALPKGRSACSRSNSTSLSLRNKEKTDPETELGPVQKQQQKLSSIRTDIVLPSGACLRINQTIPDWAIPAQEAAIRYLYQKHSTTAKSTTNSRNDECEKNDELNSQTETTALKKIAVSDSDSNSALRLRREHNYAPFPPKKAPATCTRRKERDSPNFEWNSVSTRKSSSRRRHCRDTTFSDISLHSNARNQSLREADEKGGDAFPRQRHTSYFLLQHDDSLGSLLQSQPRRQSQSDVDVDVDVDVDCDSDSDSYDRFCDASENEIAPSAHQTKIKEENRSEDRDDEDEEWLVI